MKACIDFNPLRSTLSKSIDYQFRQLFRPHFHRFQSKVVIAMLCAILSLNKKKVAQEQQDTGTEQLTL